MDSQRVMSIRGRMQQQLPTAPDGGNIEVKNAGLLRAVHESRLRQLQAAGTVPSTSNNDPPLTRDVVVPTQDE